MHESGKLNIGKKWDRIFVRIPTKHRNIKVSLLMNGFS